MSEAKLMLNDGRVTRYGEALAPLINMALEPLKAEQPEEFAALMGALARGDVTLHLLNVIGLGRPARVVLSAVDGQGVETMLATLEFDGGAVSLN
jgi:hypothetical protein